MTVILLILVIALALYLLLSLGLANYMATLIFTPPKASCPTYDEVRGRQTGKNASERELFSHTDWQAFDSWPAEPFPVQNGDILIPGVYYPLENSRGCAILVHGFGQNRLAMTPHAVIFRSLGFDVVTFDQRRFGVSEAPVVGFGSFEGKDVACVAEKAAQRLGADTPIVVCGVSMGAASILNALKYTDKIDYAVADCGFARFRGAIPYLYKSLIPLPNPFLMPVIFRRAKKLGIPVAENDPIDAAADAAIPICVVHGDKDRGVSVGDAHQLGAVLKNPRSRVEIFPGRDHAYAICDHEKYRDMLKAFLEI